MIFNTISGCSTSCVLVLLMMLCGCLRSNVESELDAQSDVELDTQSDVGPDARSDVELDVQSDVELDAQSNVELDAQSDVELDAQSDVESRRPNVSMTVDTNIVQIQRRVGTNEIATITLKKTASHLIQASQPCFCLLEWQDSKSEHAVWDTVDILSIGCNFYTVEQDVVFNWPLGALYLVEYRTNSDSILLRFSCIDGVLNDSNPRDNVFLHGPVEIFGH